MPILFLSLIYNILKVCTHGVSWRTNNKILSLHFIFLSFFFFISLCFSWANIGVTYLFTRTTTHKDKIYMLVTVIQHLMAIIKSIFLFFFFLNMRPCIDHSNNHWDLPNQKEHFKVPYFTVYPLNTNKLLVSYVYFLSCTLKEIREDYTHYTHRQN